MSKATTNNTVRVHYTGKLTSGEVFDSSLERDPIEFTVGGGQMIKGFDDAVNGMAIDEKKTVTIPCDEAYGPVNENLRQRVPKAQLPAEMKPEVGQMLVASDGNGNESHVKVVEATDEHIVVDANHPLAGEDLVFELQLMEIL